MQSNIDRSRQTAADRNALRWEILIVLAVTFGASGIRAILRLVEAATMPEDLNEQTTTLNARQSDLAWLDPAFQLISSGVLVAWGGLSLFLLIRHVPPRLGDLGAVTGPLLRLPTRARQRRALPVDRCCRCSPRHGGTSCPAWAWQH